jgi:hypothetical protein
MCRPDIACGEYLSGSLLLVQIFISLLLLDPPLVVFVPFLRLV